MSKYRTRTHIKKLMTLVMTAFLTLGGVPAEPFAATVHADAITKWEKLQTALSAGGKVTLTEDIVASDTDGALVVDRNVTLDLAGHTIDRNLTSAIAKSNGYVIGVNGNVTLILEDSVGGGCITGGNNTGDGGGVYALEGKLTMYGGIISGNKAANGGGFYGNTLELYSGEICRNTATGKGGGTYVYVEFSMHGGRIDNNTACNGGGVYFAVPLTYSFIADGGLIDENNAIGEGDNEGCGGGIYLEKKFWIKNMQNTIKNNTAYRGGGIYANCIDATFEAETYPKIYDNKVRENGQGSNIYGGFRIHERGIVYESTGSSGPGNQGVITLQGGRLQASTYKDSSVVIYYGLGYKYKVNTVGKLFTKDEIDADTLNNAAGKWILPVDEVYYFKEGKIPNVVYAASFSADQTMIPVETAGTEENEETMENGIGSWFYLENNTSYTEGLDLGTAEGTVNFILHNAKGDPYSLNVGSESAPIEDKSCLANENATLNIYSEGNISFHNSCERAPAVNLKNLNIYDGNVEINAAKSAGLKLNNGGKLTLSGGSFKANNLPEDTSITIADGKYFKDEDNNFYSGTLKKEEVAAISGKRIALAGIPRKINEAPAVNGRVTAACAFADKDSTVKLSAIPDAGYRLKEYSVTTADGQPLEVNDGSFTMPDEEVYVSASFELIPAEAPVITGQPSDLDLTEGYVSGNVLSLTAESNKEHSLSYQWYQATGSSVTGGRAIEGATRSELAVETGKPAGTEEYYYCKVTATRNDNGLSAEAISRVAKVSVKAKPVDPTPPTPPTPIDEGLKVTLKKTSFTYDGKVKTPALTVSYMGKNLKKSDYTVKWPSGRINAGKYTVTVKGNSKAFKGLKATASFKITKAKNTLKVSTKTLPVKESALKAKALTVAIKKLITVKNPQGTVKYKLISKDKGLTYNSGKKTLILKKGAGKGTYKAKFKVTAAGDKNHDKAEKEVTVKIQVKK